MMRASKWVSSVKREEEEEEEMEKEKRASGGCHLSSAGQ
jgi:hypothetical protein